MSSDFKVNLRQDFYARTTVPDKERKFLYQQRQEIKKELLDLPKKQKELTARTGLTRASNRLKKLAKQKNAIQSRIEFLQKLIKHLDLKIDFATLHPANALPIVPKNKTSCNFFGVLGKRFGKFLKFIK